MVQLLKSLIKTARPKQALKNLALLAPLVFSGYLLVPEKLLQAVFAVIVFTVITTTVYFINDMVDLPRDRLHPFKKLRPIASGTLPLPVALFVALVLLFTGLGFGALYNTFFFMSLLAYFVLQLAYSFWLKNLIVFDVIAIASGFVLRVYAGALAINVHMDVWFLLCVVSLALFLAVGKRRAELAVLDEKAAPQHRKTLSFYKAELLDAYLAMFANSAWLAYALFTFFAPKPAVDPRFSFLADLPQAFAGINKWLMLTVPVVIYGIMRYLSVIYQGSRAESPERVLLSDKSLLGAVFVWGAMVFVVVYVLGS